MNLFHERTVERLLFTRHTCAKNAIEMMTFLVMLFEIDDKLPSSVPFFISKCLASHLGQPLDRHFLVVVE